MDHKAAHEIQYHLKDVSNNSPMERYMPVEANDFLKLFFCRVALDNLVLVIYFGQNYYNSMNPMFLIWEYSGISYRLNF